MKKLLCACFGLAFLLTSCSDDDSSPAGYNSPLVSTTQKIYENGEVEEIFITEHDNGTITKMKWLTSENVQTGYTDFTYNNAGLLTSVNSYSGTTLYSSTDYSYDNQGRMTSSHQQSEGEGIDYTRTFTHNNDNTITSSSNSGWEQTKTYYLNSSGYIYKQESEGSIYELTYNGSTAVSASFNGSITTFEYDMEHDPSLININIGAGDFKPNAVLRAGSISDAIQTMANKYLIKETIDDNYVYKYLYTFNEQGLPLKRMDYSNDELRSETEYFYE